MHTSASSMLSDAPESRAVSRRAVVKAGANLAWSVPLLQVVNAGAANAVVASNKVLSITSQEGHWVTPNNNNLSVTVTVKATGGATTNLQIAIDFPVDPQRNWNPTCTLPTGSAWTADPAPGTPSRTRVFTASTQAVNNGEVTLDVSFAPSVGSNKGYAANLSGAATATGFSSGTIAIPVSGKTGK